jgi:putative transcriptional regulator
MEVHGDAENEIDTAKGLHGARVMDQVTMREFGRLCLPSVAPLEPEQSKQ